MAELADAADSKSAEGNLVGVRPPLPAPHKIKVLYCFGLSKPERPKSLVAVLMAVGFYRASRDGKPLFGPAESPRVHWQVIDRWDGRH